MDIKPCDGNGGINTLNFVDVWQPWESFLLLSAIRRKTLRLGLAPMEGDWTIIAKRTCDDAIISETDFEVKNYGKH
jgi:hypothetical protein